LADDTKGLNPDEITIAEVLKSAENNRPAAFVENPKPLSK